MEENKLPPTPSFDGDENREVLNEESIEEVIEEAIIEEDNNILDELSDTLSQERSIEAVEESTEASPDLQTSETSSQSPSEMVIPEPPIGIPAEPVLEKASSEKTSKEGQSSNPSSKEAEADKKPPEKREPEKENKFKQFLNNINVWRALSLILAVIAIFVCIQYNSLSSYSARQARDITSLKMERSDLQMERDDLKKSNSDLRDEIDDLSKTNKDLEDQIDDIKTRVDKQLDKIKEDFDKKDWQAVIDGYTALHEDFPDSTQDKEAKKLADQAQKNLDEEKAAAEQREKEQQEAQDKAREEQQQNSSQNSTNSSSSNSSQQPSTQQLQSYNTGVTFAQLSSAPADYLGQKVMFAGRVIQINYESNLTTIRLAVNGDTDMVIMGDYPPNLTSTEIDENDWITIYGVSEGENTYTSDSNGMVLTPLIEVQHITKQ